MKRRTPRLILISQAAVVFAMTLCAAAQAANHLPAVLRPVDGASIYRNNCAACHGVEGRGNGPVSKALKEGIPDLTTLSQRNNGVFPAVHVRTIITFGAGELLSAHGSKDMPIWGPFFHEIEFDRDLGQVRLENVTRYLECFQRK